MTRYHSGIAITAASGFGAGWYSDWKGALPQLPW